MSLVPRSSHVRACSWTWLLLVCPWAFWPGVVAADDPIKIGVLSHRGLESTLSMWSPTATYLSETIAEHAFEIVPLRFEEIDPALANHTVDFLLVNPGIYVNMEVRHRISRIATLNNRVADVPYNLFGGVIFTRSDDSSIHTLDDLKGVRFMAVDKTSLGGYQMALRELRDAGLDDMDFGELSFGATHDRVVLSVRNGDIDAGTVRTDILERMAHAGTIELSEFRIINPQSSPDFPLAHSTRLYPEWPFSKASHTSNDLAQRVAVALLNMPVDHAASLAGNYAGWTVPLDYQPVHDLFREFKLPPYDQIGKFTLQDAVKRYWAYLILGLGALLFTIGMMLWVWRLNTALKRVHTRLERQHDLILNSVSDGIYGVDMSGNSTFVNRAMEQITGWTAGDLIGRNQHLILHHTHADGSPHPPQECPVYQTFVDNIHRFVEDDVFWHKDGHAIPVEYSCTPIRDEKGRTVGSVVVFRDITERKQAVEKNRRHQTELAHVARLSTMGEMASGIAHELNQPLAAINTNARALIRMLESGSPASEGCADVMERIASQAERAGEIIRQLRSFIRKEQPERTRVELNDLIRDIALLIQPEARRHNVQIRLELSSGNNPVEVQKIQIEQVVLNLAHNAIEAMTEVPISSRRLTIEAGIGESGLPIVHVADTGPGLSNTVREQLFTPFVTTKPYGMGLGLSISRGIIEAHGGELKVTEPSGGGAVFSFTLLAALTDEAI